LDKLFQSQNGNILTARPFYIKYIPLCVLLAMVFSFFVY